MKLPTKTFTILATSLLVAATALANNYRVDTTHSEIAFKVSHLGISTVTGYFNDFSASFDLVEFKGAATGPMGHQRAAFVASTTINRKDFGVSWNKTLDTGGFVVGEDVRIQLELEASPSKTPTKECTSPPKRPKRPQTAQTG